MIKGSRKNMYYVRDTGSPVFSEAYFVLRHGTECPVHENDLAAEADRIIREKFSGKPRRRKITKCISVIAFLAGGAIGTALTSLVLSLFP